MATRKVVKKSTLNAAQIEAIDNLLMGQGWNVNWISQATRQKIADVLRDSKHPLFRDK
jgi:hypothetical protein